MNQPTVLVTGATGTVGSALVPALQARGVTVRAMVRIPGRTVPGVQNVVADLTDAESVAAADSPVRFLRWHAQVEEHVRRLDVEHTILRPNLYMQALLGFPAALSQASGRTIVFRDVSPDQFAEGLAGVLPRWQLDGLLEDYPHYSRGEAGSTPPWPN